MFTKTTGYGNKNIQLILKKNKVSIKISSVSYAAVATDKDFIPIFSPLIATSLLEQLNS